MAGVTEGRAGVVVLAKRLVLVSRPTSRFLIYSLSPLLFLGLAFAVAAVMHAPLPPWSDFALYSGLPPLGLPVVLLLVLLFNGFGEEAGWRGFALEPLQRRANRSRRRPCEGLDPRLIGAAAFASAQGGRHT